ncbi:helix-turn-helix domain-containing protein [Bosea sp. (in: a-proteobacteria)]|uniref:helix-turn-helix domain-containing protein n=1 Tax=Bosea sp. (in: a-proteobacteria) TaxID=1871050 RepID=UPI002FC628F0
MNNEQCRTARALLGWTAVQLGRRSGVGRRTILEFEGGDRSLLPKTILRLRAVFVVNGIEFINDEAGIGVKRCFRLEEYIGNQMTARQSAHAC